MRVTQRQRETRVRRARRQSASTRGWCGCARVWKADRETGVRACGRQTERWEMRRVSGPRVSACWEEDGSSTQLGTG